MQGPAFGLQRHAEPLWNQADLRVRRMNAAVKKLGLWSGVGLVMADMVGTGVLTTAGFMARDLSPSFILLDWFVGGLVALAGALAYTALARQIPRSGGEYRYLSSLLHPAVGYLAGWTSLLAGFSVPVALAALAAGAFSETLLPSLDARLAAAGLIMMTSALHAFNLKSSKWTQDLLAIVKAALIVGFIVLGLFYGSNTLPDWQPDAGGADSGFSAQAFFTSLIFITFCYTGWNAATYASEEFREPRRDVPRAMIIGCLSVTGIYLLMNWVFVTNLTHADMTSWIKGDTDRITLAHLVVHKLIGRTAANATSVLVIIALLSAISAMTLIGPRVYAAMAKDHFLPQLLAAKEGKPPAYSVLLQGSLATSLVFFSDFREMLNNVGSILAITTALTVLSLFRRKRWRRGERPAINALVGAAIYASMSAWMVYFSVIASKTIWLLGVPIPSVVLWMLGIVIASLIGYRLTRVVEPEAGTRDKRRRTDDTRTDYSLRPPPSASEP